MKSKINSSVIVTLLAGAVGSVLYFPPPKKFDPAFQTLEKQRIAEKVETGVLEDRVVTFELNGKHAFNGIILNDDYIATVCHGICPYSAGFQFSGGTDPDFKTETTKRLNELKVKDRSGRIYSLDSSFYCVDSETDTALVRFREKTDLPNIDIEKGIPNPYVAAKMITHELIRAGYIGSQEEGWFSVSFSRFHFEQRTGMYNTNITGKRGYSGSPLVASNRLFGILISENLGTGYASVTDAKQFELLKGKCK